MKLDINDIVELLVDIPNENLKAGNIGVIVELLKYKKEDFYEIEFCDKNGETLTTVTLNKQQIRKLHNNIW